MRRERDTIFLCWLLLHRQFSTQPTHSARSAQSRLASPSSESRLSRSEAGTQLTAFSQISAHTSSAWRHPHPQLPITLWDFYFDISEWHTLSARAWTHALMLHLALSVNVAPCTKRKVLILTKPKGKIYKTKSLRHYITNGTPHFPCLPGWNFAIIVGGVHYTSGELQPAYSSAPANCAWFHIPFNMLMVSFRFNVYQPLLVI